MRSITLSPYFALNFFVSAAVVFIGVFVMVAIVDYIESTRKAADIPDTPASLVMVISLYRVPQIVERVLPFCVLIGAMACFFRLSRRMELVVARGAGMSVGRSVRRRCWSAQ